MRIFLYLAENRIHDVSRYRKFFEKQHPGGQERNIEKTHRREKYDGSHVLFRLGSLPGGRPMLSLKWEIGDGHI